MADKDTITMIREELRRLHMINQALDNKITRANAAEILGLSQKQFLRLLRRVKSDFDKGKRVFRDLFAKV